MNRELTLQESRERRVEALVDALAAEMVAVGASAPGVAGRLIDALDADMIATLNEAAGSNQHERPCQVCFALAQMGHAAEKNVRNAVNSRTIGRNKLARILTAYGYPVGWRAIENHRTEGHS